MTGLDRVLGLVAALAVTAGLWWASTARLTPDASVQAVLRLAWSARPERIEECRPQSEDALATLPAHMRQSLICEGTTATYALEVQRNGVVIARQTVQGGGWRHDRPLYVFSDLPMPAGEASIAVRFVRVTAGPASGRPDTEAPSSAPVLLPDSVDPGRAGQSIDPDRRQREDDERRRDRDEAVPASLTLDESIRFHPREVVLVTYDAERRALVVATRSPR